MGARLKIFLSFLGLTIVTLGIYPFFFHITRQQELIDLQEKNLALLTEIRDDLKETSLRKARANHRHRLRHHRQLRHFHHLTDECYVSLR